MFPWDGSGEHNIHKYVLSHGKLCRETILRNIWTVSDRQESRRVPLYHVSGGVCLLAGSRGRVTALNSHADSSMLSQKLNEKWEFFLGCVNVKKARMGCVWRIWTDTEHLETVCS